MKRVWRMIGIVVCLVLYIRKIRPFMIFWGADESEIDEPMPGDFELADKLSSTRAITIGESKEHVWLWLSQLGRGAGYYSLEYLTNPSYRSATYLLPDLPEPQVGDRNQNLGEIREVIDSEAIAWILRGMKVPGSTIGVRHTYLLKSRGEKSTRLLVRTTLDWTGTLGQWYAFAIEPVSFLISAIQLRNLKSLIESYERREVTGSTNRHLANQHQRDLVTFAD